MKTIKINNQVVILAILAVPLMFATSCKKETLNESTSLSAVSNQDMSKKSALSPWQVKSSETSASQRLIIEMSEAGQTTCYGITYDNLNIEPLNDITITHDEGATWHQQTITGLENNIPFGVAATNAKTVHVFGWNYVSGGGNVFRSTDWFEKCLTILSLLLDS